MKKILVTIAFPFAILVLFLGKLFMPIQAQSGPITCGPIVKTYQNQVAENSAGPAILHTPGWDRYVMFFGATASIQKGKIGPYKNSPWGDPGTCRPSSLCGGNCATDKIFMTWHFGDGKSESGWDANDGYGNIPPKLVVDIDSSGQTWESGMIADPAVVYWRGKYHMYYEGTNDCIGNKNKIFHAETNDAFGTWTKTGEISGITASSGGSGLSWPSVFVEDDNLYLYFTDGTIQLRAAIANDSTGRNFVMANGGKTVIRPPAVEYINEGVVSKIGTGYVLFYDVTDFTKTLGIKVSYSNDKFNFPKGNYLIQSDIMNNLFYTQPTFLPKKDSNGQEDRLYFSGFLKASGVNHGSIYVCTITGLDQYRNLPGDLNNDSRVDIFDLRHFLTNFLQSLTIFDYNKLVENFGK